ncbi:MAG: hypothetical protein HRT44_03355, partial [Bdellovibrionales bacterium]|nr:hypothetical protein [Bdellovibrionales bacterium]NQZ18284.1 hypothetical protein [Bdellovibrionales bacterium]
IYREQIKEWLGKSQNAQHFHDMEKSSVQRLVDYLEVVDVPHAKASEFKVNERDFKLFFQQYDQRRDKNFAQTFPGPLSDWYESINV